MSEYIGVASRPTHLKVLRRFIDSREDILESLRILIHLQDSLDDSLFLHLPKLRNGALEYAVSILVSFSKTTERTYILKRSQVGPMPSWCACETRWLLRLSRRLPMGMRASASDSLWSMTVCKKQLNTLTMYPGRQRTSAIPMTVLITERGILKGVPSRNFSTLWETTLNPCHANLAVFMVSDSTREAEGV